MSHSTKLSLSGISLTYVCSGLIDLAFSCSFQSVFEVMFVFFSNKLGFAISLFPVSGHLQSNIRGHKKVYLQH